MTDLTANAIAELRAVCTEVLDAEAAWQTVGVESNRGTTEAYKAEYRTKAAEEAFADTVTPEALLVLLAALSAAESRATAAEARVEGLRAWVREATEWLDELAGHTTHADGLIHTVIVRDEGLALLAKEGPDAP